MTTTPSPPTIVVGVDNTTMSEQALIWAARHATQVGGRVVAVAVHPVMPVPHSTIPQPVIAEPADHQRDERREHLEAAITKAAEQVPGVDIRGAVINGLPGPTLCAAAEAENAVMLAVGSHGRGRVLRGLLGSVTAYCVVHASCPLLVVPATLDADRLGSDL